MPALPPLQIAPMGPGCPAQPLTIPAQFKIALFGSGGQGPYTWLLTGPPWLSLSDTSGNSTMVSGTSTTAGTYLFSISLTDGANSSPAIFSCTITVNPAVIPTVTVTGLNLTPILQPVSPGLSLAAQTPVILHGEVLLTFSANAFGETDNPRVQFLDPNATNMGRRLMFTIPAGAQVVPLADVQQDTVAGTIRVEVVSLLDGDRDVLPASHPLAEVIVPRLAPVISDVSFENESAAGFDIVISGYSTPRDMSSAKLTFAPKQGASIEGMADITVSVSDVFSRFYQSVASIAGGSAFTGLRIPVRIDGDKDAIGSVTVSLANSVGPSTAISKGR
jgi:hypothetical protein